MTDREAAYAIPRNSLTESDMSIQTPVEEDTKMKTPIGVPRGGIHEVEWIVVSICVSVCM